MTMKNALLAAESARSGVASAIRFAGLFVLAVIVGACSPQLSEQELLDRARLAMEQGDARTAEIDTKTALQQNADNAEARQLLGEIYLFQQDPGAAVGEFQRALQAVEDEETRVLYARALLSAGRGDQLLELHEEGDFSSVSGHPRYQVLLARILAGSGELQRARDLMEEALAAAPDDPHVTTTNAFFLLAYSDGPEAAKESLRNTLDSHPEFVDAWSLLGGIQQMGGEFAEAETSYSRVVELNPYRFADQLNLVTVRIDQGKTEEAREDVQRLLSGNPDHPGVNFLHGRMLVEAGDTGEGLAALQKVLGVVPGHAGSLYLAAVANINEGNLATAQGQLDRLLASQPGHLDGQLLLARLHLLMEDPEAAEEVARSILQMDAMNYQAMGLLATALDAQGQTGTESIELLERMATVRPDALEPRLALGAALLQSGDGEGGIAQFQAARDMAPQSPRALQSLIQAHLADGNIEAARTEAANYSQQQPQDPRPEIYLARIAMQENDRETALEHFSEAEERLRQAMAEQPENVGVQAMLIDTLVAQGELDEAGTMLAELPDELANDPSVLVARGRIALAGNRPEEAEPLLRGAMEASPNSMTVMWLGGALQEQNRNSDVIGLFEDWLADNPADLLVRNELAATYLQQGRNQEAREHYSEVVERAPDNVIVLNNLAWLMREEDPEQALVHIERANELVPGNPQILDTYAMVQLNLGATDEALSLNGEALELTPDDPGVRTNRAVILRAAGETEQASRILEELVDDADVAESQKEQARALLAE